MRRTTFYVILVVGIVVSYTAVLLARDYGMDRWGSLVPGVLSLSSMALWFDKSRERATWAKVVATVAGVLMFGFFTSKTLMESHTIELSRNQAEMLWRIRRAAGWVGLTLILTLVLSGQLRGRDPKEISK